MIADQWVMLTRVFSELEADLICGLLSAHGVAARKTYRSPLAGLRPVTGQAMDVEVEVLAGLLAEARAILYNKGSADG